MFSSNLNKILKEVILKLIFNIRKIFECTHELLKTSPSSNGVEKIDIFSMLPLLDLLHNVIGDVTINSFIST